MRLIRKYTNIGSQDPSIDLETVIDVQHNRKDVELPNNICRIQDKRKTRSRTASPTAAMAGRQT
jgi:hypothetical protein